MVKIHGNIRYNDDNTCDECKNKLTPGKVCKEYDKKNIWTGRWLCIKCYANVRQYGTADKNKILQIQTTYRDTKPKKKSAYNSTNTCDRCGNKLYAKNACREYNEKRDWTGKWLCTNCYKYEYAKNRADFRNNNLDPNSTVGKGYTFEQITCIARYLKNLNIESGNFHSPIDHSVDAELGIIQSKGAIYDYINDQWSFNVLNEQHKKFDHLICHCMDENMQNVERVYIFPKKEIMKRASIGIIKNPSRGTWYEKYRVDEKLYNDAYHNMDKGSVLRKGY